MSADRRHGAPAMSREDYSTEFEDLMKRMQDLLVRGFKDEDLSRSERVDLYHEASERVTDFIDDACTEADFHPYDHSDEDEDDED